MTLGKMNSRDTSQQVAKGKIKNWKIVTKMWPIQNRKKGLGSVKKLVCGQHQQKDEGPREKGWERMQLCYLFK